VEIEAMDIGQGNTQRSRRTLSRYARTCHTSIGVICRPETERMSHYFRARLPARFEAVLHFEETRAVEPLERSAGWEAGEVPETFPFAV
jgi:erythromycin esterase-like protein